MRINAWLNAHSIPFNKVQKLRIFAFLDVDIAHDAGTNIYLIDSTDIFLQFDFLPNRITKFRSLNKNTKKN